VYNAPLIPAWEKSVNNDAITKLQNGYRTKKDDLDQISIDQLVEVLEDEKCWKEGKGLTFWNSQARGPPQLQSDGTFGYDVVLITANTLTRSTGDWVLDSKYHTIIADEAHDFLRGQQHSTSNTLKTWFNLQSQTISSFLLSGSPFMTKISHDYVALTKAIAPNEKRKMWSADCSDEGLEDLISGWVGVTEKRYSRVEQEQKELRKKMGQTLAIFTLRRDENSTVRGKNVMVDYFKQCKEKAEPLVHQEGDNERQERENLYARFRGTSALRLTQQRNDDMQCLCFSDRFLRWDSCKTPARRARVWEGYTLDEGRKFIRTRTLIEYLESKKESRDGVIIFVSRCFQAELCMKVSSRLLLQLISRSASS